MEITDKINYVLGKTVVYMLLIIYPFVMHNKLNDVTLTRFFFFIIVSYVGFLVLCINSLASFILKRVSDKKKYDDELIQECDQEGRVLLLEYSNVFILNIYFPAGIELV